VPSGASGNEVKHPLAWAKPRPLGRSSNVALDPLRSFGDPAVRSVPTSVIAEEFRAGDSPESIAAGFELELQDVYDALRFKMGTGVLAA